MTTRTPWIAPAFASALACALVSLAGQLSTAGAGTLRGQVELSGAAPGAGVARANPYPGRANSLPRARNVDVGGPAETVVVLDKLPAGVHVPAAPSGVKPNLEQKGQAFSPRVLAVQAGTTVEFPNRDPIYHNVFSVSPAKRFDLGKYAQGQSRSVRFDKPGVVNVYCDIHSDMAAWIYVVPHHAFAQANAAGRFTLPDLPAGHYTLRAWHPDRGERTVEVDVPARGEAAVTIQL